MSRYPLLFMFNGAMVLISMYSYHKSVLFEIQHAKEAMELSEAKTNFLASMSHEIRTPINAILTASRPWRSSISSECEEKVEHMRSCTAAEDWKGYGLMAHSIKGLTASLGLKELSERAKKHEYAAREQDTGFIRSDCEPFLRRIRRYVISCGNSRRERFDRDRMSTMGHKEGNV